MKEAAYKGSRDPKFVAVHRGGLLDPTQHHLPAAWAADCAEHVLPLFASRNPDDDRPRRAVEVARAWAQGKVTVTEAREAAYAAHAAAREASDPVAREVARAAGHAVATAHMADHELGAAAYAIRAVRLASKETSREEAGRRECEWQRNQLPDSIRELVISDQVKRNKKLSLVFTC